jgi:hypothetical protein
VGQLQILARDAAGHLPWRTLVALDIFSERYMLRRCLECGRRFIGHHGAGACSDECREKRRLRQVAKSNARKAEKRKARRKTTCAVCDGPMNSWRGSKRYCSTRCRQAGYRKWGKQSRVTVTK